MEAGGERLRTLLVCSLSSNASRAQKLSEPLIRSPSSAGQRNCYTPVAVFCKFLPVIRYLHQWLAPEWWNARFCFPMERSVLELPIYLLVFGAFYSLPAYLAFTNPAPISASIAVLAIVVSILGNNLNVAADFWKSGQKAAGVKHCSTNIYDGGNPSRPIVNACLLQSCILSAA